MNEELNKYYEVLGVAPDTSGQELKGAYRDLAKVWHPDRFSHDPRLQQKAQEKLKEINEAYERLTSERELRRPRSAPAPERPREPAASPNAYATSNATVATVPPRERKRPRVFLPTALVFCAVFVVALISFVPSGAPPALDQTPSIEQAVAQPSDRKQEPESEIHAAAGQPLRGKERTARTMPVETTTSAEPSPEPRVQQLRPMPTVTVNVDAMTGLLATRDCPNVNTLTYPAGEQPRTHCTVQHKTKIVPRDDATPSKSSRLKSIGKTLVGPFN